MLSRVRSGALRGIEALVVDVEVDVSSGLPHTTTVGLPDGAVREASDRIRAARRSAPTSAWRRSSTAAPHCFETAVGDHVPSATYLLLV
jgi:Mg-chelatase subunit ChlI-like protein